MFDDLEPLPLEEAYSKLYQIADDDENEKYPNLQAVHIEQGWAVASNNHHMGLLPIKEDDYTVTFPAPETHATDTVTADPETGIVTVECTHQTDYSGEYEYDGTYPEEWKEYAKAIRKKGELIQANFTATDFQKLGGALNEDDSQMPLTISFQKTGDNKVDRSQPIVVEGDIGKGILMPLDND